MSVPAPISHAVSTPALGRALVIVGDIWGLRIIRSTFVGHRSFRSLRQALGISDAVLSRRLSALVADGVLTHPASDPDCRSREYRLTEAGKDLWRVMVAIRSWDQSWAGPAHRDSKIELVHLTCGQVTHPVLGCGACGAIGLRAHDVTASPDQSLLREVRATRSRRAARSDDPVDAARVLGDHWATLVLACALMGASSFQDFQDSLDIPPATLTSRLKDFVDAGILTREAHRSGGRRQVYRLTPAGLDFFPVSAMLNDWSRDWLSPDAQSGLSLTHRACGAELRPQFTCNSCNGVLHRTDVRFRGYNLEGAP